MKRSIIVPFIVLSAVTGILGAGVLDNLPFFGFSVDYHQRRGYLDFGNDRIEEVRRNDFPAVGILLGKRWRLAPWVRLQASASVKYGSVVDDTLPAILLSDNTSQETLLRTSFLYGNCLADVQFPFRAAPDGQWFLHAGGGGHVAKAWETEVLAGNTAQRVADAYLEEHTIFSASVHGGLGFEIAISPRFGFAIEYTLRYWYPIYYGMQRDLFPTASVGYRERFLSHEFDVLFLVKR